MERKLKGNNIVITTLFSIIGAIALISISTIIFLNSTWIYNIAIDMFELERKSGVLRTGLISDYKGLINYLQNPFIDKLEFKNFIMSTNGEIHFEEVKAIFMVLILISVIAIIALIVHIVISKRKNNGFNKLYKVLNNSSNILIGFFIFIGALYLIDFSWAFEMFHKIFFRNDYWIFNPRLDPIILALPEEFFMICGAGIIVILVIIVVITKSIYYKNKES